MSEIRGTVPGIVPLKGKPVAITTIHTDAYMIACRNGFEGTEEEWLEALNGMSAYDSAKEGGYAGTEAEFYADLALFDERAQSAKDEAVNAAASANSATNSANAASGHANAANVSAAAASNSSAAAERSAEQASASENAAKAAQAAAEKARDDAQSIAGGDFASTAYVDGKAATAEQNANSYTNDQINTHNESSGAHADIRQAVGAAQRTADEAKAAIPTNTSQLTNDSGYLTSVPVTSVNGKTGAVSLGASDVGARPDTWTPSAADVGASAVGHNHDDRYYTEGEIDAKLQNLPVVGHTHTKSEITDFPTLTTENWTFTLEDGSTVTKAVYVG